MLTRTDDTTHTEAEITRPKALQFDPARYRADVDLFDITDEQKQELLLTLWGIMRSFVELGFAVDVCAALGTDLIPSTGDEDER